MDAKNWAGRSDLSIERMFGEAVSEVFRFETLPEYHVAGEWELYQEYLAGHPVTPDPSFDGFLDAIRQGRKAGRQHRLVRLIPSTPSKYLTFETELFYRPRATAGEEIRFIDEGDVPPDRRRGDFFLFDESIAFELLFDRAGQFLGERQVSLADLPSFLDLRTLLLRSSARRDL